MAPNASRLVVLGPTSRASVGRNISCVDTALLITRYGSRQDPPPLESRPQPFFLLDTIIFYTWQQFVYKESTIPGQTERKLRWYVINYTYYDLCLYKVDNMHIYCKYYPRSCANLAQ